jgi:hypothetical protein
LDGWKEIASHLGRSVRCVQRWELSLALPVHRIHHVDDYTVYAYLAELEAWRRSRDRVEPPVSRDEAPATIVPTPELLIIPPSSQWSAPVSTLYHKLLRAIPSRAARPKGQDLSCLSAHVASAFCLS